MTVGSVWEIRLSVTVLGTFVHYFQFVDNPNPSKNKLFPKRKIPKFRTSLSYDTTLSFPSIPQSQFPNSASKWTKRMEQTRRFMITI
ncbi:hypothetical protein M378DRAFT_167141 [Amanita muscaria Koide BX008]|uniref:Uncharacterized protein n=1 Tax=Amanita muscaria (strain Koide BX008) TaxID=946122 RepID=A0A0C2WWW9_AMAMK|nr:hypothetical protein M378DRAFT_167141 [Amanita muscaria Koide BX008]